MNVGIRLASKENLEDVLVVHKGSHSAELYDNPDWFYEESISLGRVFVAIQDDIVCGFLVYQILWGNSPYLALIKVDEKSQRQQVGTKLVEALENELKTKSYKFLISSTEEENHESVLFHESLGFTKSGRMEGIEQDEIFYKKEI